MSRGPLYRGWPGRGKAVQSRREGLVAERDLYQRFEELSVAAEAASAMLPPLDPDRVPRVGDVEKGEAWLSYRSKAPL